MKVALVYDRVNKVGGAERILTALHELFPEAPLYTAVYDPISAVWANTIEVKPSWLQAIPYAKNHHEFFPWATPFAFESFDFDAYDLVISVTSAEAKFIITKPQTKHICYCLTPTRYLWSGHDQYLKNPGFGHGNWFSSGVFHLLTPILKKWDLYASHLPDNYVAISELVKRRIQYYYRRPVDAVIYPPIETNVFVPGKKQTKPSYFLYVSRLVSYKRPDIIVDAFNKIGYPLLIIGTGSELHVLKKRAKANIRFITDLLSDAELVSYYQSCRAFVFAGEEDFGIVAGEALSCGKPVIAYKESGVSEIVKDGETGILFAKQTAGSLIDAVRQFEKMHFSETVCRDSVLRFDTRFFKESFLAYIKNVYNTKI